MKTSLTFALIFILNQITVAQTLVSGHSHNDYLQEKPFYEAHSLSFGSIEADLFLINDTIFVAHHKREIKSEYTLFKLYINPILELVEKNNGHIYTDHEPLRLLLDLKENGTLILQKLMLDLEPFQKKLKNVKFVFSGDMPPPELFSAFPSYFQFDGRMKLEYSKTAWKRVDLVSESMSSIIGAWNGKNELSESDFLKLKAFADKVHQKGKPVRLWGTPNTTIAFQTLQNAGYDIIGADDLNLLSSFLRSNPKK